MKEQNTGIQSLINKIGELDTLSSGPIVIAIDGMSGSGKTTLAKELGSMYPCNVFHMDDFFLQANQRSKERLNEIGGNVDYERFMVEVLEPISQKKPVTYRPYNCSNATLEPGIIIPYKKINIVEGSYSMHSYFDSSYSLQVFLKISKSLQIERIGKRNGQKLLQRFINEWIPKEDSYHEAFDLMQRCDILIPCD